MDSNPTFGHQELMETLSQGSTKSKGNSSSTSQSMNEKSKNAKNGNSSHNMSSGSSSFQAGEAYRRVGLKLSRKAHGESVNNHNSTRSFFSTSAPTSCFQSYPAYCLQRQEEESSGSPQAAAASFRIPIPASSTTPSDNDHDRSSPPDTCSDQDDRYRKVQKKRYSDHGNHHHIPPLLIVRKLTMEARDSYLQWEHTHKRKQQKQQEEQQQRQQYRSKRDDEVSPQRHAFSRMALEHTNNSNKWGKEPTYHAELLGPPHNTSKGLLSAVLEGHSDSNTTASGAGYASASISTKDSKTVLSSLGGGGMGAASIASNSRATRGGKCLTAPPEAVANDGWDNVEGNLIVFEHDSIRIPKRNMHTAGKNDSSSLLQENAEYTVQGLLGQGTFAQVFQCKHAQTGQIVAIKIVKNKPAYTRQATVEIDVFRALKEGNNACAGGSMVDLQCYFMHRSHLCLVFELLGQNLYEILKRRQFRGLPLTTVRDIVKQAIMSIRELSQKSIVHCDLKPENVLLVSDKEADELVATGESRRRVTGSSETQSSMPFASGDSATTPSNTSSQSTIQACHTQDSFDGRKAAPDTVNGRIKLIDFGSACFEGYTAHTYIQSRFYRSPEVLVGLPYDSVIDIWSLGCVAAELFLGLPILPGIHEHDQLGRIAEMISPLPDWMLDQGSKASKYYLKYVPRPVTADSNASTPPFRAGHTTSESPAPVLPQWRLKTQQEYIGSLSQAEIRKKGGLSRLEQQPGNRYFRRTRLSDILFLHGLNLVAEDKELLPAFVHFLYGLLEPDPWKRWTSFQAVQHPFITGDLTKLKEKPQHMELEAKEENHANIALSVYWEAPWDPAICRRKLLNVQRMREKQQTMRRSMSGRPSPAQTGVSVDGSPERRRSGRMGEPATPVYGSQNNGTNKSRTSPPSQISSRASMALATELSRHSVERQLPGGNRQTGNYIASSSLTSLGQSGQQGQLIVGDASPANQRAMAALPSSYMSGPQSYSGLGNTHARVLNEGDFALALQRPGVVPGTGDASIASVGTAGTGQGPDFPPQMHSSQIPQNHVNVHQGSTSYSHGPGYSGQPVTGSSLPGQGFGGLSLPGQFVNPYGSQNMLNLAGSGVNVPNQASSSVSVASSVTMSEATPGIDLQQQVSQLQAQQRQAAAYQRQQSFATNQTMALPPGYTLPQQQLFLATAPDGGTYYVTTSATGQPIVLQPVSMADSSVASQLGQAFQGQPNGLLPGQQFQQMQPAMGIPGQMLPGMSVSGEAQARFSVPGQGLPQQGFQQQYVQPNVTQQQPTMLFGNASGQHGQPYGNPYGNPRQKQRYAKGGTSM